MSVFWMRNILKRYPLPESEWEAMDKEAPGELVHIDLKKMPNIKGENLKKKFYEAALLDDCTRVTYRDRLPNKKAKTLACFLDHACAWFKRKHGGIKYQTPLEKLTEIQKQKIIKKCNPSVIWVDSWRRDALVSFLTA
jgi:hypothetical protein